MITLHVFGPAFDLPDPSPFVIKTDVQLKMSGLPYRSERGGFEKAPKGKIPFIEDGDRLIGDSTFIRDHLEKRHDIDLDRALSAAQRAQGWAIERMLEDHLYWAMVHGRWMDDANFAKGPAHFFAGAPDSVRQQARERMRAALHAHGMGRHSEAEIAELGGRSLAALASWLGDKPYLMGAEPCGVDATAFAMASGTLTPFFMTQLRSRAAGHANLVAYSDRMMRRFYPDFAPMAASGMR
jgi:glutathione S-transferase